MRPERVLALHPVRRLAALNLALNLRMGAGHKVGGVLLFVPLERLYYDLYHWLVHRLGLLGITDLGYREGHLETIALSSLGAAVLGRKGAAAVHAGGLLVNPDFEILQFPGGAHEAEDAFTLSRFAERIGADRVKRYRLTRESVKRAILAGMHLSAIESFLKTRARTAVPRSTTPRAIAERPEPPMPTK